MATVIREGTFTKTIYGFIRDQKYEDAIQVLTYQLQLFPRSRAALSLLAYSYFFAGDFGNAVQTYEVLVKYYPNVTRYKIYYAQSLLKAGLYEEATKNSLRVKEEEYVGACCCWLVGLPWFVVFVLVDLNCAGRKKSALVDVLLWLVVLYCSLRPQRPSDNDSMVCRNL